MRTPSGCGNNTRQNTSSRGENGAPDRWEGGITKRKLQGGEIFFYLDVRERDGSMGVVCRCGGGGGGASNAYYWCRAGPGCIEILPIIASSSAVT